MNLPFLPTEVDKLSDLNKKDETLMTNAILLGPPQLKGGLNEKPTLWDHVITSHKTGVAHPIPQPVTYAVNPLTSQAFAIDAGQVQQQAAIPNGSYSIPVQISGEASQDPTLSGYESPSFIHKKEKIHTQNEIKKTINSPESTISETMEADIKTFIGQFENAKDKEERTQVLMQGKVRLSGENQLLSVKVEAEIKELLFAKEVAIKLNNLIAKYEAKMNKDLLSKLKLSDEITIKNILRDKMHREIQGFRTGKNEYKELEMVNPDDVLNVIKEIKLKLGQ